MIKENEKKKNFNANDEYKAIFEGEKYIPVPAWLKPIIHLALIKMYQFGYSHGYASGKRIAEIRHNNWLESELAKYLDQMQKCEQIKINGK